jgi:hypothetical protein
MADFATGLSEGLPCGRLAGYLVNLENMNKVRNSNANSSQSTLSE